MLQPNMISQRACAASCATVMSAVCLLDLFMGLVVLFVALAWLELEAGCGVLNTSTQGLQGDRVRGRCPHTGPQTSAEVENVLIQPRVDITCLLRRVWPCSVCHCHRRGDRGGPFTGGGGGSEELLVHDRRRVCLVFER